MPFIPCLDCAILTTATRCPRCHALHRREQERRRKPRPAYRRKYNDPVYRANRRTLLASAQTCTICNTPPTTKSPLEVDHRVPLSAGGGNDLNNLRVVCRKCNNGLRVGSIPEPAPAAPTALNMRF